MRSVTCRLFLAVLLLLPAAAAHAQSGNASPAQPSSSSTQKPWWERITFYGDLRLRYEGITPGSGNTTPRAKRQQRREESSK